MRYKTLQNLFEADAKFAVQKEGRKSWSYFESYHNN